uniref:Uncharacterized protein n=1 Tax=Cacopsylla melanoneura TaxID=428564 RepID=A0A8D8Y2S4_9HEMI
MNHIIIVLDQTVTWDESNPGPPPARQTSVLLRIRLWGLVPYNLGMITQNIIIQKVMTLSNGHLFLLRLKRKQVEILRKAPIVLQGMTCITIHSIISNLLLGYLPYQ